MSASAREDATKLIKQYFLQLTQGCGSTQCNNADCANGRGCPMDPTEAATAALALAAKGNSNLCTKSAIVAVNHSSFRKTLATASVRPARTLSLSITEVHEPSGQLTRFSKSGQPEACPISSLDAALSWIPGYDDLCVPTIPLCHLVNLTASTPRMLICHDMMGGYQKDRFVQGHREADDYYFYHWQSVEAFIYFSHHFLSIPPPCWTNAAHRNGRLSLGTMITEWKDGAECCARLLSSEEKVTQLAQQMMMMAQYYKFDGWLINIENPINGALMDRLYTFLSLLTTGMHDIHPRSKIIWYDSVTVDGNLKWQNSLNKMNQPFFDLCDGIFLNYLWKLPLLQASGALAADRRADVYVGVDVFGRKCYGGGGYNTNKAMAVIKNTSLSSAVFAPGWVYETQPKANFFDNQDKFWSLLEAHCPPGESHCLPVVSSFGRGCGETIYIDGTLVYCGHWSNISAQDLQPSFFSEILRNNTKSGVYLESAQIDHSVAYYGGSSMKIRGKIITTESNLPGTARLFRTDINSAPLIVSYSVLKTQLVSHFLQLQCTGSVLLLDPDHHSTGTEEVYGLPVSGEVELPNGWPSAALYRLGALPPPHCNVLHEIFTGERNPAEQWKTKYFIVSGKYLKGPVTTVGLALVPTDSCDKICPYEIDLNLGEVKILDAKCISPEETLSCIENIHITDLVVSPEKSQLSFTLKWMAVNYSLDPITHCNIYSTSLLAVSNETQIPAWKGERVYLGTAYANSFRVTQMHILSSDLRKQPFGLELRVQLVTLARRKHNVKYADSITVWFTP